MSSVAEIAARAAILAIELIEKELDDDDAQKEAATETARILKSKLLMRQRMQDRLEARRRG